MSYLKKRQNLLSDCPIQEVEEAFSRIAHHFGDAWLEKESGTHALQILWNRRDALSTNELFTFGKSLIAAESASSNWLKGQIKLVRGKDENNQKGAVFEILAVGYTASRQSVIPAPANQPGYDIDIETQKGTRYRASLKRYSQSLHEKLFLKKSAHAEDKFIDGLKRSGYNALLYIEAKEYPDEADWQLLYQVMYQLGSTFKGSKQIIEIRSRWLVGLLPLAPEPNEIFSTDHISHSFICSSPYHNNEQNNFLSKLESAVSNLERHVACNLERVPIIIMQLPVTASASILTSWAQEYLNSNKSSALEAVFFLQPYNASNTDMSSSHIAYFASTAVSDSFHARANQRLEFEVPVGIVTTQPPKWRLISDIGQQQLSAQYVYQQGKLYVLASSDGAGSLSAHVTRKAPRIETIAVFNLKGQNRMLRGRWGEQLSLIGG